MTSHALTSKENIKDRLQLTTTSFDDLIDRLILSITDKIERMCNRRFVQATYTHELYDGSDSFGSRRMALIVKNAPIGALAAVEYKAGTNSDPDWTPVDEDEYDLDAKSGILYFNFGLPVGKQNIRLTYTGGYAAYSIGVNSYWKYNITPTGTVDGSNRTFTLPEAAGEITVYADGIRIIPSNYAFTAGDDSFELNDGAQPYSTILADYLPSAADPDSGDDVDLPFDIVEVCEEAVVRLFKRRDSEGRASETFQESSITWNANVFTDENLSTIRSYRRASFI